MEPTAISSCFVHARCLPHLQYQICEGGREYRTKAERSFIKDICSLFDGFSLEPTNVGKLESLGLADLTEAIIQDGPTGEEMVRRWLHLESDPEVIAAQEEEIIADISQSFDLSASATASTMDMDITVESQPDISTSTEFTLSERTIKNLLLKYSQAAIASNISDPVLLALTKGIESHLLP